MNLKKDEMNVKHSLLALMLGSGVVLSGCSNGDDVPPAENEEELIDKVTLTFTPVGGTPVVQTATDPDGEGVGEMTADGAIILETGTEYTLSIRLDNTIEGENITKEIEGENDEHMFFFSFTADIFHDPAGNGNIDNREDDINYSDTDDNNLPVGLTTTWTSSANTSSNGSFRVVLKHQPDGIKTATSTAKEGVSDIDLSWAINIR